MSDGPLSSTIQPGTATDNCAGTEPSTGIAPTTVRVRLHRARKLRGLLPLRIDVYLSEIKTLVEAGLLTAEAKDDREAVAAAVEQLLDQVFGELQDRR